MSSPAPSGGTRGTSAILWRFLVDENQPRLLVGSLRAAGYHAEDVRDVGLAHHPDSDVWRYAQVQSETVITEDRDFSDIRVYPPPHAGIVIVALPDSLTVSSEVQIS